MQCRNCGTEIADKAIVCYRCGHATTDPVRRAVPIKPRRSPLIFIVVAAVLLLLALYSGYVSYDSPQPDRWQAISGVFGGAALMVVILGLLRWRRR